MIFCRYVLILQHNQRKSRLYVFHRAFRQQFGRFCDNLPIEPDGVPSLPNVGLGSWLCENVRPIAWDFEASGFGGVVGWILRFCRFDWLTGSCEPDVAVLGGDLAG